MHQPLQPKAESSPRDRHRNVKGRGGGAAAYSAGIWIKLPSNLMSGVLYRWMQRWLDNLYSRKRAHLRFTGLSFQRMRTKPGFVTELAELQTPPLSLGDTDLCEIKPFVACLSLSICSTAVASFSKSHDDPIGAQSHIRPKQMECAVCTCFLQQYKRIFRKSGGRPFNLSINRSLRQLRAMLFVQNCKN